MKKYFIEALIAIILVTGIFAGCYFSARSQPDTVYVQQPTPVYVQQPTPVYVQQPTPVYVQPSQEYYWVHDGRVYQRDRPGHYYVYDGGRRGTYIQDTNFTVRIEKEGRQFRNYNEANEHLRKKGHR